jgi:hypothetical protein
MTVIIDITQLNGGAFGTVKSTDVYPAVDVTDVTQSPSGTTKPYQIAQLTTFLVASLGITTYQAVITCSTTNLIATYNNGISGVGSTLTNSGVFLPFSLNGQMGIVGGRYLIKDQTNLAQNGIYTLSVLGDGISIPWVLTRAIDFNSSSNIINGGVVYIPAGTINSNTLWQVTFTGTVIVGTTLLSWSLFSFNPNMNNFTWNVVTGISQQIINNNGYIPKNVALTTFTLPLTASVGDTFIIKGFHGTGGWIIAQNASQQIYVGNVFSSAGVLGSVSSTLPTDSAAVTCLQNDTLWSIVPTGNLTLV